MLQEKRHKGVPSTQGLVDEDQAMRCGLIYRIASFPGPRSVLVRQLCDISSSRLSCYWTLDS